jgi:hypothetical protein
VPLPRHARCKGSSSIGLRLLALPRNTIPSLLAIDDNGLLRQGIVELQTTRELLIIPRIAAPFIGKLGLQCDLIAQLLNAGAAGLQIEVTEAVTQGSLGFDS